MCSVSLEEKLFNDSREHCYVQLTNDSRKINFVLNQTLLSKYRNVFVRAWAIVFDAGKHVSNIIQLPTHCSLDNSTYNVWINKKYINLTDCNIEINNNTIGIFYKFSSPLNIPYECHVLDGDNVIKLNENIETLIDLTHTSNNTKRTVTLRFRVCHGDQRTITCSLLPKDSKMTSSKDTLLIIVVSIAIMFILFGCPVLYGLWKKCLKKRKEKNVTSTDFNSEKDVFLDKKTQDECNKTKSCSVLLTGKVGTGKSSTGNTILGREFFKTSRNIHISPCVIEKKSVNYGNIEMIIVDGPNFDPAVRNDSEKLKELFQHFQESLQLVPNGFDAILIVIRYGSKFTAEDVKTFEILKLALGNDVLKNYGIIVLTYGDTFLLEHPNEGYLQEWCCKQEG
ncbi:GTPase IMAP family member 8, partial [Biomphalaria pfeifferi]